jgi:hypothetical protein
VVAGALTDVASPAKKILPATVYLKAFLSFGYSTPTALNE